MKKFLLFAFIISANYCFAQPGDETAVRQLLKDQTQAWNRGDIDSFMKTYWESDSLTFIGKNGITYGWINTLNNYKKGYPDVTAMGKLSFTLLKIKRLSGKFYYVVGKWFLKRTIGDVGGYFNLLFQKVNGEWLIIADHSS